MTMMAKLTSKNQLTLPQEIVRRFPETRYFEVSEAEGRIVLTPLRISKADAVRDKLAELGITETDIADAKAWARHAR